MGGMGGGLAPPTALPSVTTTATVVTAESNRHIFVLVVGLIFKEFCTVSRATSVLSFYGSLLLKLGGDEESVLV